VQVEEGARVEARTPIASGVGRVHRVRLPAELHGFTGFRKRPGDGVKAGETLAVLTYQMGFGLAEYVCPVDGVIETILERAIIIRDHAASWLAGLPGVVTRVIPDQKIEIEATGHLIPGWAGSGAPVSGPAYLAGELYTPGGIDRALGPQIQGAVVVSLSYTAGRALELAARHGAAALVCASLSYAELAAFSANFRPSLPLYPGGTGGLRQLGAGPGGQGSARGMPGPGGVCVRRATGRGEAGSVCSRRMWS